MKKITKELKNKLKGKGVITTRSIIANLVIAQATYSSGKIRINYS